MCALAKFLDASCQSSGTVIGLFRAGSKFACTVVQRVGAAAELIDAVLQISDILRCCGRLIRQLLQAAARSTYPSAAAGRCQGRLSTDLRLP